MVYRVSSALAFITCAGLASSACRHVNDASEAQAAAVSSGSSQPILTQPALFDCKILDYGLYWYGQGNTAQKAVAGSRSAFFDPTRPTLLYAHGWQPGAVKNRAREDLSWLDPDTKQKVNQADAWLAAGWNVGVFYWTQFADEDDVRSAEGKIWTLSDPLAPPVGMRWRQCDGSFSTVGSPTASVGEVLYQSYRDAMVGYQGDEVRLLGHSLGNQVVSRLAELMAAGVTSGDLTPNELPTRVALVDPWWSYAPAPGTAPAPASAPAPAPAPSPTPAVVPWHAPDTFRVAQQLGAGGVLFERYQTSDILAAAHGDPNAALTQLIGLTIQIPAFISDPDPQVEIGNRHGVAPRLYLLDFSFPPPVGCIGQSCGPSVPSSSMTDAQLRLTLSKPATWLQVAGTMTATPVDDSYNKQ